MLISSIFELRLASLRFITTATVQWSVAVLAFLTSLLFYPRPFLFSSSPSQ
jgi:hypothetical protein